MRKLKKSKRKLYGVISMLVGIAIFVVIISVSDANRQEGIPLDETNPGLYFLLMFLSMPCVLAIVYGAINAFMPARGSSVYIDNTKLFGIKCFDSKYKANDINGLIYEIKQKLDAKGFNQLNGKTQAFWRPITGGSQAFYFAAQSELDEKDKLIESVNAVWRSVAQARSAGNNNRHIGVNTILFFPIQNVSDEQLISLFHLRETMAEKTEAIINLCLYDLTEKNAYTTFYEVDTQGIVADLGGAFVQNFVAGTNKMEITASKSITKNLKKAEEKKTEQVVNKKHYDLSGLTEFTVNINKKLFIFCVISCAVLISAFAILLIVWLITHMMETVLFFCLFVPLLLMPGLALFYFSLSVYKKIIITSNSVLLKRIFKDVDVFSAKLEYAEKLVPGFGVYKKVFVVFPQGTKLDGDLVFKANNFRKYVIIKFDDYNKAVLEKVLGSPQ